MIVFREKIFDGYVSGTQGVFTNSDYALLLGSTGEIHMALTVLGVKGSDTSVRVEYQMSFDGTRWIVVGDALGSTGVGPGDVADPLLFFASAYVLSHVRFRIVLTGTTPAGLFRLWATGRSPAVGVV
jgi:hypothetical protein